MIYAKELRLGNLVYGPNEVLETIAGIGNVGANGYKFESMYPIPLTELWLVKFGFIKDETPVENETMLTGGGDNGFHGAIAYRSPEYDIFCIKRNFILL